MKKRFWLIIFACLALLTGCSIGSPPEVNLQPVTLQLQWITQAQFAGYYVALEKGWYRQEGIDLTIKPGSNDLSAVDEVASGRSDFGTCFLADLSTSVEKGQPVISIGQIQQMNGLLLIAKESSGIKRPSDFVGKKIGIWGSSWEAQLNALLTRERIDRADVQIVTQGYDMQPFLNDEIDVVSAMVYNEYHQILESGVKKLDLNIIDYVLYGLGFPGDVLFTHRRTIDQDPDLCVRMLHASLRGWEYAIDNPGEAVDIVLKYDQTGKQSRAHQLSMMREISRLVRVPWQEELGLGYTDPTAVKQMINTLVRYKVLQAPLATEIVYTNDFWEQVQFRYKGK